ncbi:hypothetical protein FFWV33_05220 [Flavobacterium faecale]|uniref:Outer membrane protein beta-barrel domain-containing protein n=1 Tax=Flavobacterium faecale TaxID=1355330 RepID=A0A2S1LB61_9FLAO|nr:DUF6646 family protein [Flavobacterium faecale]AWG20979.1 hypothetical protein FFWV33_05220 [Flavobacterium faecale]
MKKIFTLILVSAALFVNAQAFKGKGDTKFDIGANIQDGGSGIRVAADFGVAENISFGVVSSYLLGVSKIDGIKPDFGDRFDIKGRFDAHLGPILTLGQNVDIYPGLDLSLRNFGAHLGGRYFFSEGIGVFSEIGFPIAKYDPTTTDNFQNLNNQFVFNIGVSFNL